MKIEELSAKNFHTILGFDKDGNFSGAAVTIINGRVVGYLTVSEFAKKCGVAEVTVRAWINRGLLTPGQYLKIGRDKWIKEGTTISKRKAGRPKKNEQ